MFVFKAFPLSLKFEHFTWKYGDLHWFPRLQNANSKASNVEDSPDLARRSAVAFWPKLLTEDEIAWPPGRQSKGVSKRWKKQVCLTNVEKCFKNLKKKSTS